MKTPIGRKPNAAASQWRGKTIDVQIESVGVHKDVRQAIGWYEHQVQEPLNITSPFAGLVRFLGKEGKEELLKLQPVHTERVKVIITENSEGVLPARGERWSVALSGATETERGLLLFGQVTTILTEAPCGHPLVRAFETLATKNAWCFVRTEKWTEHDAYEVDEIRTFRYRGKFRSASLSRDAVGRPIVTLSLSEVQRQARFWNEDERCTEWGRWRAIANTSYNLHNVYSVGDDFHAHNGHRPRWTYEVAFSDDLEDY